VKDQGNGRNYATGTFVPESEVEKTIGYDLTSMIEARKSAIEKAVKVYQEGTSATASPYSDKMVEIAAGVAFDEAIKYLTGGTK